MSGRNVGWARGGEVNAGFLVMITALVTKNIKQLLKYLVNLLRRTNLPAGAFGSALDLDGSGNLRGENDGQNLTYPRRSGSGRGNCTGIGSRWHQSVDCPWIGSESLTFRWRSKRAFERAFSCQLERTPWHLEGDQQPFEWLLNDNRCQPHGAA